MKKHYVYTLARLSELPVTKTVPLALYAQQKIWWFCGIVFEDGPLLLPEANMLYQVSSFHQEVSQS
jgi:hypothetical protein